MSKTHPNHEEDPINYNKKGKKRTGVGKFLAKLGKNVAPSLLEAVGVGDLAKAVGIISDDPDNAGLTQQEAQEFFKLVELEYQDRQDARSMQVETNKSENATQLAKNFVYYLAGGVLVFSFSVIIMLFFVEIPENNKPIIDMSIGMLIGTGVGSILQYFFGSSQGSKNKEGILGKIQSFYSK